MPFSCHIRHKRDPGAEDEGGNPAAASAVWLASEIVPASATTVISVSRFAALTALIGLPLKTWRLPLCGLRLDGRDLLVVDGW
jgi:hypothetical protein